MVWTNPCQRKRYSLYVHLSAKSTMALGYKLINVLNVSLWLKRGLDTTNDTAVVVMPAFRTETSVLL